MVKSKHINELIKIHCKFLGNLVSYLGEPAVPMTSGVHMATGIKRKLLSKMIVPKLSQDEINEGKSQKSGLTYHHSYNQVNFSRKGKSFTLIDVETNETITFQPTLSSLMITSITMPHSQPVMLETSDLNSSLKKLLSISIPKL